MEGKITPEIKHTSLVKNTSHFVPRLRAPIIDGRCSHSLKSHQQQKSSSHTAFY